MLVNLLKNKVNILLFAMLLLGAGCQSELDLDAYENGEEPMLPADGCVKLIDGVLQTDATDCVTSSCEEGDDCFRVPLYMGQVSCYFDSIPSPDELVCFQHPKYRVSITTSTL